MSQLLGLIRTMRPQQWTKNGFIFVPIFFDGNLLRLEALVPTLAGFGFLCLMSGTVYIINDLADIEADRAHPTKRNRPLPSGQLSSRVATAAAILIPLVVLPLAALISSGLALVLGSYLALQIAYSFYLKNQVLIDVMTIAAGFVLRVVAGVTIIGVERFSPWMYLFTTMLALFLGFSKRRQELVLLEEKAGSTRSILEQYSIRLLDEMIIIVLTSSLITYSLYTFSAEGLPPNNEMMLTIPFVVYGLFRYLWLIHVKGETAPPDQVLLKDRPLQVTVLLWGMAVFALLYLYG